MNPIDPKSSDPKSSSRRKERTARMILAAPLAALLVLGGAATSSLSAQTEFIEVALGRPSAVRIVQGRSHTIQTNRGFADLVVGDPDIADVMPLTDRSLYVLGKKLGTTNGSIYDATKQLIGVIEIDVTAVIDE